MKIKRSTKRLLALLGLLPAAVLALGTIYMLGMQHLEGTPRTFMQSLQWATETLTTTGYGGDNHWNHPALGLFVILAQFMGQFGGHPAQAVEGFLEPRQGSIERRHQLAQLLWEMLRLKTAVQIRRGDIRGLFRDPVKGPQSPLRHPPAQPGGQERREDHGDPQVAAEFRHQGLFVAAVHGQLQRAFRKGAHQDRKLLAIGGLDFQGRTGARRPWNSREFCHSRALDPHLALPIQQAPVSLFRSPFRVPPWESVGASGPGEGIGLGQQDHGILGCKTAPQGHIHEEGEEAHHRQGRQGKTDLKTA